MADDLPLRYCMAYLGCTFSPTRLWQLAERQHGVVARRQLLALGLHPQAIKRRVENGRLHRLWPGVFAVGRPHVTRHGLWMAATLTCGEEAVLADESAATLSDMDGCERSYVIQVIVPPGVRRRRQGISVRTARLNPAHVGTIEGIPVTSPARTVLDLARTRSRYDLETAINQADKHDLIDPEGLREALSEFAGLPGASKLRRTLDQRTFVLTEAGVERHFLPVARGIGLSKPLTQQWLNGYRVDFFWPGLGLVVETDGLRYHRTAAQQARDLVRTQAHFAAGLWPLRFTHGQVRFEKGYVEESLLDTLRRIRTAGTPSRT
jgi:very-short-patch-repair endonuclease